MDQEARGEVAQPEAEMPKKRDLFQEMMEIAQGNEGGVTRKNSDPEMHDRKEAKALSRSISGKGGRRSSASGQGNLDPKKMDDKKGKGKKAIEPLPLKPSVSSPSITVSAGPLKEGACQSDRSDIVHKQGWLMVKLVDDKKFKKRWVVLQMKRASLHSSASATSKNVKGTIDLTVPYCRVVLRGSANQNFLFGLSFSGGGYDFKGSSLEDVSDWIVAFEKAIVSKMDIQSALRSSAPVAFSSSSSSSSSSHPVSSANLDKFRILVEYLTSPEAAETRRSIIAIVPKKEEKAVADQMVHMFEVTKGTHEFLQGMINDTIAKSSRYGTLFRGNDFVEKALTSYCSIVGKDYLRRALKPLFMSVCNSSCDYEIDPTKVSPGTDIQANSSNLLSIVQMVFAKIASSKFTNVPFPIRRLCRDLAAATKSKYPDGVFSVVGGLFFLRFVCPALTLPNEHGVWDEPLEVNAKRTLLLITKTLMNLSNGVEFGKKEEYMVPMNSFINSNQQQMHKFFEEMLLPTESQTEEQKAEELELATLESLRQTPPNPAVMRDFVAFLQCNLSRIQETGLDSAALQLLEEGLAAAK